VPAVPGGDSLAGRVRVSGVRVSRRVADGHGASPVCVVSAADVGDRRDDLRRQPDAACGLVPGGLEDDVEQEAYVGAPEKGTRGRGVTQKAIVAIAVEVRGKGCGRVRMQRVASLTSENLLGFIEETVAPGWVDDRDGDDETLHATIVETDALSIYRPLARTAYEHVVINQAASDDPAHVTMPQVHRVASLLKRWLLGTHQGGVQQRHLDAYLDEFVFRFNRRASRDRGKLFYRLLELAAVHDQTTYRQLVGERDPRPA
jgi:hypothetical protein